ncbi:MAG: protein translocase subunit SecD, partial [Saprospiraceae bacterium]|nr:protein translocase subunit SecD [Saprospiraceae bacterium]
MQGKGIVKFFLVLLTIVTLVQFLYMIPTIKIEKQADAYGEEAAAQVAEDDKYAAAKNARTAYLDSMSSEVVLKVPLLKSYTYEELKKMQLALGLDLKGGMSVVLQVDLKDFLLQLADNSQNPIFRQALDSAEIQLRNTQTDFVTLFGQEWAKLSQGQNLAAIFSRNRSLVDEKDLTFETPDAEVIRMLREEANETVGLTFNLLKDRIDKFGVAQPNISLDASRDLINVELPGVDNPQRARNFLQSTAKLEFWNVYRITDPGILQSFLDADDRLRREAAGDTSTTDEPEMRMDTVVSDVVDSLGNVMGQDTQYVEVPVETNPLDNVGPLLSMLNLNSGATTLQFPLSVMGAAEANKRNAIDQLLQRENIKNMFPRDLEFRWAAKPYTDINTGEPTNMHFLYAIKKERGREEAPLQGDHVVSATSEPDPTTGEVQVTLVMNNRGAKIWADMTTKAAQDNEREIAIALDDEVVSAPGVREPITQGRSSISGGFTVQEGKDLANILEIGKLPAKTQIIQESLVGPSLGQENINKSLRSLLIGLSLVLLFMMFYYGTAGIVSIVALFANLFFIFGGLASFGTVLTIPGMAGIVLTIGMAVDANVIIFERIREELREGKSLRLAIEDGFRQSYSAIIDANVTTILVAIVLAYFGLGPIKGFAVVLIIGVLSSLFTAVLLGRMMIDWWTSKEGRSMSFWTPSTKNVLANLSIDWLGKRRIGYVVSS